MGIFSSLGKTLAQVNPIAGLINTGMSAYNALTKKPAMPQPQPVPQLPAAKPIGPTLPTYASLAPTYNTSTSGTTTPKIAPQAAPMAPAKPAMAASTPTAPIPPPQNTNYNSYQPSAATYTPPAPYTGQSGATINPSTGGSTYGGPTSSPTPTPGPTLPQTPAVPDAMRTAVTDAEAEYKKYAQLSPEEMADQKQLDDLNASFRSAYVNAEGQPIPLEFITGQQANLEKRALAFAEPIQARMARSQAQRLASLDASKFALERADKAVGATEVGGNLVRYNPATGGYDTVYNAPTAASDGFTLSEGQARYDAAGKLVAGREKSPDAITPYQSAQLDIERQRLAQGKAPTAEQSKARQFAVSAKNANDILTTNTYNLGNIEVENIPNFLKSPERQEFEQASRAFVNAVLRRESGATITDSEFLNKQKELIPQAGDSQVVKDRKAAARAAAAQSIEEAGYSGGTGEAPQDDPLGLFSQPVSAGANSSKGGSVSFRNNNPLNIKYGNFAAGFGAQPSTKATDGGQFAHFPTVEAGLQAARSLLRANSYTSLPLEQAMRRWSGNGYGADVAPANLRGKTTGQMTDAELTQLIESMKKREGWSGPSNIG